MKLEGKIRDEAAQCPCGECKNDIRLFYELDYEYTGDNNPVIELHITNGVFNTHDLVKAAAEKFATEHNFEITWEGE